MSPVLALAWSCCWRQGPGQRRHFEPFEEEYKLRYRCGVMYEMVPPPRTTNAIATRIKVMANLDIAERRLPQDGRIELNVGGNRVDMRVSILPTMFGESSVIRVLDRGNVGLDLNRVGMDAKMLASFRELIKRPNGITLVTGPTGSGKTTTLYSALNELNEITDKIITCEDPIEYDIDGIIQVPINRTSALLATPLRAICARSDIILVGEIRDLERHRSRCKPLTGHGVQRFIRTMPQHDPHARWAWRRFSDRDAEGILSAGAQDLRVPHRVDPSDEISRTQPERRTAGKKFYYGRAVIAAKHRQGRLGIFEPSITTTARRSARRRSLPKLPQARHAAFTRGRLHAIYNGHTTIEKSCASVTDDD